MRTKIKLKDSYTYPDIVGVCGELKLEDDHFDTLLNPLLIIEVLSPSTEAYDRGEKFQHYRKIDTLQEYVMISQDRVFVERYLRQTDDSWVLTETHDLNSSIRLISINCTLVIADVYKRVTFDEQPPAPQNGTSE